MVDLAWRFASLRECKVYDIGSWPWSFSYCVATQVFVRPCLKKMHSLTKPSRSSYVRFNKGQFSGRRTSFAQKECTNRKGDSRKSLLIQFLAPQIVPSPSNKGEINLWRTLISKYCWRTHTYMNYIHSSFGFKNRGLVGLKTWKLQQFVLTILTTIVPYHSSVPYHG